MTFITLPNNGSTLCLDKIVSISKVHWPEDEPDTESKYTYWFDVTFDGGTTQTFGYGSEELLDSFGADSYADIWSAERYIEVHDDYVHLCKSLGVDAVKYIGTGVDNYVYEDFKKDVDDRLGHSRSKNKDATHQVL